MTEYIDKETMRSIIRDEESKHGLMGCAWIEMAMDRQPAADVAPVRHGHLISTGMDELWAEFGNCTECGGDNYIKAEFCNWCGAKLT